MNKSKLLTFAVIMLFLINIVTLSFFIFKGQKGNDMRSKRPMPREIVIKKLHFDDEQAAQYVALIKTHRDSISKIDEKIKMYKNGLYNELSKTDNQNVIDNLFVQIATAQTSIEKLHYNHFLDIKKLCKPNQLKDYNDLTTELAMIFDNKLPPPMDKRHEH
ncbi:MAG: protein CpxP [Flavobacterium sp.]|jgi:protein CpxP